MDETMATDNSATNEATLLRVISCGEDGFINFWIVEIKGKEEESVNKIGESIHSHMTAALGAT